MALQMKDSQQNTGGGILQGEAVECLGEAISLIDDVAKTTSRDMTDQERQGLLLSKFHSHHLRGIMLRTMGRPSEAVIDHDVCLGLGGSSEMKALAHFNKGNALMMQRENANKSLAAAVTSFESALSIAPDTVEVFPVLVECHKAMKKFGKREWGRLVKRLEAVASSLEKEGSSKQQSNIYFALYEAAEAEKDRAKAFRYLDKARSIEFASRGKADYLDMMHTTHHQLSMIFNEEFFRNPGLYHAPSVSSAMKAKGEDNGPIFIVGMMRSGSTLLETILDLHPSIQGIGEYSVFNANLNTFRHELVQSLQAYGKHYQRQMEMGIGGDGTNVAMGDGEKSPSEVLSSYAKEVLREMRSSAVRMHGRTDGKEQQHKHILDKMLFNYKNVGFVHLVFPRSVILHMVRDPMDNLFSAYRKKFDDSGMEWTLSGEQLVGTYVQYLRLMQHFRRVLPGRVMDVPFEVMVNHPEAVLRSIIDRVGDVEWDKRMLDLQSSSRVILTHSRTQLSGGIHNSSIGAWTKYAPQLQPLAAELRKHLPLLRKEGALPFEQWYNWNLDPKFDYPASVREMAAFMGIIGKTGDGQDKRGADEEDGDVSTTTKRKVDDGDDEGEEEEEEKAEGHGKLSSNIEWCKDKIVAWEWDRIQGSDTNAMEGEDGAADSSRDNWEDLASMLRQQRRRKRDSKGKGGTKLVTKTDVKPETHESPALARNLVGNLTFCEQSAQKLLVQLQGTLQLAAKEAQTLRMLSPRDSILTYYRMAIIAINAEPGTVFVDEGDIQRAFLVLEILAESTPGQHCNSDSASFFSLPILQTELTRQGATAAAINGHTRKAEKMLHELTAASPKDIDAWDRLTEVQRAQGDFEGAVRSITQAITVLVHAQQAAGSRMLLRSKLLLALDQTETACADLVEAERSLSKGEGRALYSMKDTKEEENKATLWHLLGKCEHQFGHLDRAVSLYNASINILDGIIGEFGQVVRAKLAEVLYDLSVSLTTGGKHIEALSTMDKIISSGIQAKNVYGFRGLLMQNLGRCREALKAFDVVLTRFDPLEPTSLLLSGVCSQNLGDYPTAISFYNRAAHVDASSTAKLRREVALFQMMQMDAATRSEEAALPVAVIQGLAFGKSQPQFRSISSDNNDGDFPSARAIRLGLVNADLEVTPSLVESKRFLVQASSAPRELLAPFLSNVSETQQFSQFLQLKEPGFLPHLTLHRQFRFSVTHMAQTLVSLLASSSENGAGLADWRTFFEIGRRWRAASESMDTVFWSDDLDLRDHFRERIGMNTYLQLGINEVVRYYPQLPRALDITKEWLLRTGYYNEHDDLVPLDPQGIVAMRVHEAKSLRDLYDAVGQNFLIVTEVPTVVVPLSDNGESKSSGTMDGVIFCLIKSRTTANGWDFSVNAASTSTRFKRYARQLEVSFGKVKSAVRRSRNTRGDSHFVLDAALELFYYWANFGALTRGTSAVGYASIKAILLSAGFDVSKRLPSGMQLDWEAFFASSPRAFINAVGRYLIVTPCKVCPEELPSVAELISSVEDIHRVLLIE
jgi:tetratricopeptide (TPR) repeat protein